MIKHHEFHFDLRASSPEMMSTNFNEHEMHKLVMLQGGGGGKEGRRGQLSRLGGWRGMKMYGGGWRGREGK